MRLVHQRQKTPTLALFKIWTRSFRILQLAALVTVYSVRAAESTGAAAPPLMWDPICGFDYSPEKHAQRLRQLEFMKAALLFRCLELVEWPEGKSPDKEMTLGLLGTSAFSEAAKSLSGRSVGGRTLRITDLPDVKDANCHVVFISSSEKRREEEHLKSLGALPILTVGETPKFAQRGGMINLVINGPKVEIEVNPTTAQSARFQMPPRLTKLAKVVPKD